MSEIGTQPGLAESIDHGRQDDMFLSQDAARLLHAAVSSNRIDLSRDSYNPREVESMLLTVLEDVSSEERIDSMLRHLGFFGQNGFETVLARDAMALRDRPPQGVGGWLVVAADLNQLKPVNDKYGHLVGDALITGTAGILKSAFRRSDTLGHPHGDEYYVVAPVANKDHAARMMRGRPGEEGNDDRENRRGLLRQIKQRTLELQKTFRLRYPDWPAGAGGISVGWHYLSRADITRLYEVYQQNLARYEKIANRSVRHTETIEVPSFSKLVTHPADLAMYKHKSATRRSSGILPRGGRPEIVSN